MEAVGMPNIRLRSVNVGHGPDNVIGQARAFKHEEPRRDLRRAVCCTHYAVFG